MVWCQKMAQCIAYNQESRHYWHDSCSNSKQKTPVRLHIDWTLPWHFQTFERGRQWEYQNMEWASGSPFAGCTKHMTTQLIHRFYPGWDKPNMPNVLCKAMSASGISWDQCLVLNGAKTPFLWLMLDSTEDYSIKPCAGKLCMGRHLSLWLVLNWLQLSQDCSTALPHFRNKCDCKPADISHPLFGKGGRYYKETVLQQQSWTYLAMQNWFALCCWHLTARKPKRSLMLETVFKHW